ncbi:tetratricopeptide repeat protein [Alkalicoccus urumqiensis]|uniref:Tetratricopeptide repeat protein n=1 Tax=Alkalicoccus urumqiensis TaxID=1548213 RepID=A0A2P6MJ74_ALKUR|nr:hypothetical protein [Alkalicoccus urumqiensis]PRO66325.1 hypothetical protein C6I21_05845 [Alkalicoccus urumqiensis]
MRLFSFFHSSKKEHASAKRSEAFEEALRRFDEERKKNPMEAEAALADAGKAISSVPEKHDWHMAAGEFYASRRDASSHEKLKNVSRSHIEAAPEIIEAFKKEYHKESLLDFIPPDIPAFHRLAEIYEEEGNIDGAIDVAAEAEKLGIRDGTPGGFAARKERLMEKRRSR